MASNVYETDSCSGERSHHCAIPAHKIAKSFSASLGKVFCIHMQFYVGMNHFFKVKSFLVSLRFCDQSMLTTSACHGALRSLGGM